MKTYTIQEILEEHLLEIEQQYTMHLLDDRMDDYVKHELNYFIDDMKYRTENLAIKCWEYMWHEFEEDVKNVIEFIDDYFDYIQNHGCCKHQAMYNVLFGLEHRYLAESGEDDDYIKFVQELTVKMVATIWDRVRDEKESREIQ